MTVLFQYFDESVDIYVEEDEILISADGVPSHLSPYFPETYDDSENGFLAKSGMQGEDIPAYVFCSQPGDVITFNMNVWHAAFGGYEDRRNCSFGFYSNPKTAQEKEELQAQVENAKKIKTEMAN